MAIRKINLDHVQNDPDIDAMRGLEPMYSAPVIESFNAEDAVLGHGRRIVARVGLQGSDAWSVPDTNPDLDTQTHPERGVQREVARIPALKLTPGCFLRAMVLALPAGQTSAEDGLGHPWKAGGREGSVDATITYYNIIDDPEVVELSMITPPSGEAGGAQPQGDGGAWKALYTMRSGLLLPGAVVGDASLAAWSENVTAEIVIYYQSSPRVIDFVIYEEPYFYAASTADTLWAAPLHTSSAGEPLKKLPSPYPVEQAIAGVNGGGTLTLAAAAERQRRSLGPMLWTHTVYRESFAPVDATEPVASTVSTDDFSELVSSETAFSADQPGVSVSSGANGRVFETSHDQLVLRDKDNVVAVRCWVYGRVNNGSATGVVRFQTAPWSVVEVVVTGTGYDWFSMTGHIRCGLGPQDPTVLQVFGKVTTAYTLSWKYLAIEYVNLT